MTAGDTVGEAAGQPADPPPRTPPEQVVALVRRARRRARTEVLARRARRRLRLGTPVSGPRLLQGRDATGDAGRLVPAPVFLLSSVRSGSTLMRMVLDSHRDICAPHEMHLRQVKVDLSNPNAEIGMKACGFTARDLENLLWDRVFHVELIRAGKSVIVDKTPHNVRDWQRLINYWPQARFLFLLRHPVSVVDSMNRAWPKESAEHHMEVMTNFARGLAAARKTLPGVTVRYEDFVADPVKGSKTICDWLDLPWDEAMLDYAAQDRGRYTSRLGDWSKTIKSGKIRPPAPMPTDVPDDLREACDLLGY